MHLVVRRRLDIVRGARVDGSGRGLSMGTTLDPALATVDPVSGAFAFTPTAPGPVQVELAISNPFGEAVQRFDVLVEEASGADGGAEGGPPRFTSTPDTAARCGVPYRYSGARRPLVEGQGPFRFSLRPALGLPLPEGVSVDEATGEITWTPAPGDEGVHPVALRVDGAAGSATSSFAIVVECDRRLAVECGCAGPASAEPEPWWLAAVALLLFGALGAARPPALARRDAERLAGRSAVRR